MLAVDSQSPSTTAVIGSTLSNDSHSSSGTLYKFKNNIKQRFSAEHPERSVISINRTTTDSPAHSNIHRHSTDGGCCVCDCDLQQSQMQTQQPHQPQQLSSDAVHHHLLNYHLVYQENIIHCRVYQYLHYILRVLITYH
ncbi:uncharacterized protein LOC142333254 [Lycorma delicatula]|uniref:uncharacterized protein LOC142333254 n=1 Tax=Lycorma delicatula TaxID=130591 RepID=UPI003F511C7B